MQMDGCICGKIDADGWMDADVDGCGYRWTIVDADGWMHIHPSYDQEWSEMAGNKKVRNCWEWLNGCSCLYKTGGQGTAEVHLA